MDKPHSVIMRLEQVSKTFFSPTARIEILKHSDFTIAKGETLAVVGASGIGKSTLLNIIGTLDRPDQGRVMFRDQDLFSMGDNQLAAFRNERIGFVFQ
ncbi:MAG: ATP-binding cassette domain-containing protein, partial [Desulfobacteraceae bacterium]|nr:ATP-binding cassette domain-containing protein [Desulfobacteraceae bacterium]